MKQILIIIGATVVVLVGGVVAYRTLRPNSQTSSTTSTQTPATADTSATPAATTMANGCPVPPANTLSYCKGAFNELTVASGTAVTFRNDSTSAVDIDSDPHPQHTDDTQLNIGVLQPNQSKTVTLTKVGNWGIHNHLRASEQGNIVVQ